MTDLPDLKTFEASFESEILTASSLEALESLRLKYLGRKGQVNVLMESLKSVPPEQKQSWGKEVNLLKQKIQTQITAKFSDEENRQFEIALQKQKQDWTLPAASILTGKTHPITQVLEEISDIFIGMGFSIEEGPQIETDENNFGALNIPADHPARDMHDTFYIEQEKGATNWLLRTHTSPVQIRTLRSQKPPIRMIAPGKVFRHEAIDPTHSSVFHQLEALTVDKNVSFADLKGTLEIFVKRFFGSAVKIRMIPSYFPFVEPGAQVDITCSICQGNDARCAVCKGSGWLEMLGAGMVHPNVLKACGHDPLLYSGYAFGLGIERVAMIRYGVKDMRLFYENHLDFLKQF